ncbi:MAG: efflux RND transporter periplasmic adaptor subunit [Gammaproteobacteria bacterium]|nr:efflux RND transporter periplasmic adaptor subunit [Gammaproteobacteria bacterium]
MNKAWPWADQYRYTLSVVAVLTVVLLAGCSEPPEETRSRRGGGPVTVEVAIAGTQVLSDRIEALGTTFANESVTLTAKVTDTVGKVRFEDGQFVEAGTVLVELTNEEEQALLEEAQASLRDAVNQRNRLKDLRAQNVVSASNLDEAEARVDGARARLNTIVARLKDRLVRAPFSGLLGFRQVSEGTLITPGTAITTLDDVSVIKLDFTVPETALAALERGQNIKARSAAYGQREFEGVVSSIGSRVDPVTRAIVVRALIENPDRALRPGMLMTVQLITRERDALVVPESAVIQLGSEAYLFKITDDGRASRQLVRPGARRRGVVEILEGVAEGDQIITEGIIKVRDGTPVKTADAAVNVAGKALEENQP